MCRQLILIAKNEQGQMVFTCEHGTMHLTHQQTTLCLAQAEFIRFAQWVVEGNLFVLNQSGDWCVKEADDGRVEIWLGSGGLLLSVMDFFALSDLLSLSLRRLEAFHRSQTVHRTKPDPSLN